MQFKSSTNTKSMCTLRNIKVTFPFHDGITVGVFLTSEKCLCSKVFYQHRRLFIVLKFKTTADLWHK